MGSQEWRWGVSKLKDSSIEIIQSEWQREKKTKGLCPNTEGSRNQDPHPKTHTSTGKREKYDE